MKSETIGKLAEALAKAQSEMSNAAKDKNNPFFKSKYADLTSVWDACRDPLTKNGLAVTQIIAIYEQGGVILKSVLLHSSGEWVESMMPVVPVKNDPQSMGSAITYARRFALSALVGVAPGDDDDGNEASGRSHEPVRPKMEPKASVAPKMPIAPPIDNPRISRDQAAELVALCKDAGETKEDMATHLKSYKIEKIVDCDHKTYVELRDYFVSKINFMKKVRSEADQVFGAFDDGIVEQK